MPKQGISIAIEGVIGSGKTTLAHALADELGAIRLFESDIDNPYLERFYKQKQRNALNCQLWFLQARMRQFSAKLASGVPVVADHSLIKEQIFAEVNLAGEEFELYRALAEQLMPISSFKPDVIIYLKADIDELGRRIKQRAVSMESAIQWPYLEQLIAAYEAYFSEIDHQQRVLVVSTDLINIAEDKAALKRLIKACIEATPGISYCNPVS